MTTATTVTRPSDPEIKPERSGLVAAQGSVFRLRSNFFWPEDMQPVVHFIRKCLCIMLPTTVASSVVDDSFNQP